MELNVVILSRIQFALSIMFHYLFVLRWTLATFLYAVAIGNMTQSILLDNRHEYTRRVVPVLNPYSLTVGVIAITAFALQGAIYLYRKAIFNIVPAHSLTILNAASSQKTISIMLLIPVF